MLALGARVLSATTPFVAASASRSNLEQQLELTSRLQHLMLAAARLAGRHGVAAAVGSAMTAEAVPARTSGAPAQVSEGVVMINGANGAQEHHHHHRLFHGPHRTHSSVGSKLRASMSKLAARKAHRKQGFGALGRKGATALQTYRQVKSPVQSTEPPFWAGAGVTSNTAAPAWQQQQATALGLQDGMGLAEDMQQQQLLVAESEPAPAPADLAHPWSWDVTQPLTVLSVGVKVGCLFHYSWGVILLPRAGTGCSGNFRRYDR